MEKEHDGAQAAVRERPSDEGRPGPTDKQGAGAGGKAEDEDARGDAALRHVGTQAAARFLRRRGYEVVAQGWSCDAGKVDIVARDGDTVVFVKVAACPEPGQGMPAEELGPDGRSRAEQVAALFLQDYDVVDVQVRFDVMGIIVLGPDRAMVRHHIDVFGA